MDDCDASGLPILSGSFTGYRSQMKINVKLFNTKITVEFFSNVSKKPSDSVIFLKDIIGCKVISTEKAKSLTFLSIFCYPLSETKRKSATRKRYCHRFVIDSGSVKQENIDTAKLWKCKIDYLIRNKEPSEDFTEELLQRKMLVFMNPYSGTGGAKKIYKSTVVPMLDEAEILHKLVVTEYAGHARSLSRQEDLNKWDGFVVIGGDGLINEIINGLMERTDWEDAIKMPLGIVPAGSGNGLATSIVYQSTGYHFVNNLVLMCMFEICKGFVVPLDITSVEMENSEPITPGDQNNGHLGIKNVTYCFLSVIIGFIADVDIEGEKLRFLGGEIRNYIYAIMRLITMRKYPIEISYLPSNKTTMEITGTDNAIGNTPSNTNQNAHANAILGAGDSIKPLRPSILSCPPLSQAVPDNWITSQGDYIQVTATFVSHIALQKIMFANSKLNDGDIYLQIINGDATRSDILDIWDKMDNGIGSLLDDSSENDKIKSICCNAFRLTPKPKYSDILTVDGECIPFGTIQCEVHRGLARILCSNAMK